jgi:hypothetical protein
VTGDLTEADFGLLAELGALLRRYDPVPAEVAEAAAAAFAPLSRAEGSVPGFGAGPRSDG